MGGRRTASVRAKKKCQLLKLSKKQFEEIKLKQPDLAQKLFLDIMSITMKRYIEMSELVKQLLE